MLFAERVHLLLALMVIGGIHMCANTGSEAALPEGVVGHGVAAPVGKSTWGPSIIALENAAGKRVVFIKLWTGSHTSYLFIDAETGKTEQVAPVAGGWGAYQVLKGSDGMIYDTMGSHMVAINPETRKSRKIGKTPGGMALSFAEAKDGTIFAGIYPTATLVSYDPKAKKYKDWGALNDEEWPQYPRPLAFDDAGWVYCGIAIVKTQVVGLNRATGEKVELIPEDKRQRGKPALHLGTDGKVYASAPGWGWHVLRAGKATPVEKPAAAARVRGDKTFPDGSRWVAADVPNRLLRIVDKGEKQPRDVHFDYRSTGVNIYTIATGPDGKIYGATGIPLRIWQFDPDTGKFWDRGLGGYGGHVNQFALQGDKFFGAIYSHGALIEYDPAQPYDDANMNKSKNPRRVDSAAARKRARDLYGRPSAVLAHPDGRHVLVAGAAARTLTGGGMLIYDRQTSESTVLGRRALIRDQATQALAALPGGDIVGGTTVKASTGGTNKATAATVYRMKLDTHKIVGKWVPEPATTGVRDMLVGKDGLVYGLADPDRFFVLDPDKGEFLYDAPVEGYGVASGYQAPRCMTWGPDGMIYAIFREAVVRIDPKTRKHEAVARPGVRITTGIAILDGRLYFASGPKLYSCALD